VESARPPGEEDSLEKRIEEAWGQGPEERPALSPERLRRRIRIQRLVFGAIWLLLLPYLIWLIWPLIDRVVWSRPGRPDARLVSARSQLGEVRAKLRDARARRARLPRGERSAEQQFAARELDEEILTLEVKERAVQSELAGYPGGDEEGGTRVAVGVVGLVIWMLLVAVVLRSRSETPAPRTPD